MNVTTRWARVLTLIFIILTTATVASAQITTGVVTGTVKDAQGGIIPGASATLTSVARGTSLAPTVTNQQGDFTIAAVPVGTYTLEVTVNGFKPLKRELSVSGGDRVVLSGLVLEVGGLNDVVSVVAEAPLVQAQSGERSFTVTSSSVENLPIAGRSFINMALLAPGVGNTTASAAGASEQNLTRLGGGGAGNFTINGVGVMDTGNGNVPLLLNNDAVQEVRVVTSGYQAEYGRSSGMQITAITKGGTNNFRGSVYDIERNSDWNANGWAAARNGQAKPVVRERDFGFTIGGPVGKPGGANKVFFFVSQEFRPREIGGSIRNFRVPTAAERAGDFSQTRRNDGTLFPFIKDPLIAGTCNATNQTACFRDGGVLGKIPGNRLSPLGLAVLNLWPMPNNEAGYTVNNNYNFTDTSPTVNSHLSQQSFRGDYAVSPTLQVRGSFTGQNATKKANQSGQLFPQGTALLNGFNDAIETKPQVYTYSLGANYSLNQTTFLEGSFGGVVRYVGTMTVTDKSNRNNVGLGNFPLLIPSALTVDPRWSLYQRLLDDAPPFFQDGKILGLPVFSWGNLIANAPPNTRDVNPLAAINNTWDTSITITKVLGPHTYKAGYFFENGRKAQSDRGLTGLPAYQGAVSFANDTNNPLDTGYGFANAAIGGLTSYAQRSGVLEGIYIYQNHEFFVQDNWKVSRKLTMDYGVRFVHQTPQYDENGFAGNFIPSEWNAAAAPVLYRPVCAPGVNAPCSGQNLRAFDPVSGLTLPAGSGTLVGQIVPNSGNVVNGVFNAGEGPVAKTVYTLPGLVVAPRFGMAYDWSGSQKLVLRGGFGLFHDRTPADNLYGMVGNPASAYAVTVTNTTIADLQAGSTAGVASPKRLLAIDYESPISSSIQWNVGVQVAIPWSTVVDVLYVGQHSYSTLQTVDVNPPAFGAAFLAQNQDPTKSSTVPGAAALGADFYRPYKGFGQINYIWPIGHNMFNSMQTSVNRRFRDGFQFTVNYTLSKNTELTGTQRVDAANGAFALRGDNEQANYTTSPNDRRHVLRGNFVWDMPDMSREGSAAHRVLAEVVNDWQLSSVLTAGSGAPYTVGFGVTGLNTNVNYTGTPNYNARVLINGNTGGGCSSDYTRQFTTSAFSAPLPSATSPSLGLESGLNYMTGCWDHTLDFALARNIRLGGARQIQIRVEAFNALNSAIINGRNTTIQYNNLADATAGIPSNLPYDANGNVIASRTIPQSAGFGVATTAQSMRSMQVQVRFAF